LQIAVADSGAFFSLRCAPICRWKIEFAESQFVWQDFLSLIMPQEFQGLSIVGILELGVTTAALI